MKGMKCRQTGMAGEVWQALGFTVSPPFREVTIWAI
jgi:TRAP-type mannitol/chloroaromatic compound transport system substrate-binding protein